MEKNNVDIHAAPACSRSDAAAAGLEGRRVSTECVPMGNRSSNTRASQVSKTREGFERFSDGSSQDVPAASKLAELFRRRRAVLGLRQYELAERVGVTGSVISEYESGGVKPKVENLKRVAKVLGVKHADVVDAYLAS